MRNIVLLGPPGSGKGTQAKLLSKEFGYCHISTGDLLRKMIDQDAEFKSSVDDLLSKGKLLSDEVVIKLVAKEYDENQDKKGFIFDGFPRTVDQAKYLNEMLLQRYVKIDYIVVLDVSSKIIKRRILGRYSCNVCGMIFNKYFSPSVVDGICNNCGNSALVFRSDDNETTIDERLNNYKLNTLPVIDYFSNLGMKNIVVNAESSSEKVFLDIVKKISD